MWFLRLTRKLRAPSYPGLIRSVSWLLMHWFLVSPRHQQQWFWPCKLFRPLSYTRNNFNSLCHATVEEWQKLKINIYVSAIPFYMDYFHDRQRTAPAHIRYQMLNMKAHFTHGKGGSANKISDERLSLFRNESVYHLLPFCVYMKKTSIWRVQIPIITNYRMYSVISCTVNTNYLFTNSSIASTNIDIDINRIDRWFSYLHYNLTIAACQ